MWGNREVPVRTQGFCPTHAWEVARLGARFPLEVAYRTVLQTVSEHLAKHAMLPSVSGPMSKLRGWLRKRQQPKRTRSSCQRPCPFCDARTEIEQRVLSTLLDHLEAPAFEETLAQSDGLCLLHMELACAQAVLPVQQHWVERLLADLEEFLRKHDYRFLDEPRGPEMMTWRRACDMISGKPLIR